jgi:hypothetical protein
MLFNVAVGYSLYAGEAGDAVAGRRALRVLDEHERSRTSFDSLGWALRRINGVMNR